MKAIIERIKRRALARAQRDARNRISNFFANRRFAESIGFEEVDIDESHAVFERGLMTLKLPTEVLEEHNALASRGLSVHPNPQWRKPVYGMGFSPGRRKAKARKKRRKP